jgi:chaperonin GroES
LIKALKGAISMDLTPLHDRVVVRREKELARTAGGIYIPDTAREKQQIGFIVAVGKGRIGKDGSVTPLDVKVGDRVLFGKYAGTEAPRSYFEDDGEELVIMKEDEILGILGTKGKNAEKPEKAGAARR